jgi:hypothetical protein
MTGRFLIFFAGSARFGTVAAKLIDFLGLRRGRFIPWLLADLLS